MPHKPEYSDYEPVTRSKSSKRFAEGFAEDKELERWGPGSTSPSSCGTLLDGSARPLAGSEASATSDEPLRAKPVTQTGMATYAADQKVPKDGFQESWILKRGHAVSFAGLFLFTLVLYFRPYELFPTLTWLVSIAFWIATFTLIVFIPTQLGLEGTLTTRPREVNLVLLLVFTALLSIPLALDRGAAWGSFIEYLKVIAMFIVLVNVVRTEKRLRALLLLLLAASTIVSVAAVSDYRVGNLALEGKRIEGVIGGLFSNPNDLALHLVTVVPLTVGLLLASRNLLSKIVYAICGLVLVTGIVVTFSRGGFVGLFCVVLFLVWRLTGRRRVIFPILGLTLVIGLIALVPAAFRSRIATTEDASAIARIDDLKRSVYLAVRHPVFGIGMGNYVLFSNRAKATHNAYTQVAAELGLAAAVLYLLFLIAPLKKLRDIELENRDIRKKPKLYYLAIAIQASLIGYMVASFFASVAYLWYAYYLVGYGVCLRRIYGQVREKAPKEAPTLAFRGN
ncbi:MAG: O-antigen ligase family protein [Pyrinomonadaceae bacterium]